MAGNEFGVLSKRNKLNPTISNVDEENEDRLSSLPDSLILHILSFLYNCSTNCQTAEVVRTCILSRRWQFLWTGMSKLYLSDNSSNHDDIKRFVERVGRIFAMCNGFYLKRFRVHFQYKECFASNVNFWVHFLVKNKVKTISLTMAGSDEYVLPQVLYIHSSMASVNINSCKIDPKGVIQWGSLKRLWIQNVDLTDSLMEEILSSCPVLKVLRLYNVNGLTCINISSPILNKLDLSYGDYNILNHVVEILAPNLHILLIKDYARARRFRVKNVSSLVRAEINLKGYRTREIHVFPDTVSYIKEILLSLHSVMDFQLGYWSTKVISSLELIGWKLPPSNRVSLTIRSFIEEGSFPGIMNILSSSPYLKTLIIKGKVIPADKIILSLTKDQVAAYLQNRKFDLVLSHLKNIEMANFNEEFLLSETMLILVELLLMSSKVLKKLVIHDFVGSYDKSEKVGKDSTPFDKFVLKVQAFPRASTRAVVLVRRDKYLL